jgi:hypothetical protein
LYTLVNDKVGKDTPIKKPKTTPKNVVKSILMVSFGFLLPALQHNICKYFIGKVVIKSKPKKNLSKEETIKHYIYIYIYMNQQKSEPECKDSHCVYNSRSN